MHASYLAHLEILQARAESALAVAGLDSLMLGSGSAQRRFMDDTAYPFRAHADFVQWLPQLAAYSDSWLLIRPGKKPRLLLCLPEDFWHLPPQPPRGDWTYAFEIEIFASAAMAGLALNRLGRVGLIAAQNPVFAQPDWQQNPPALLSALHYERACKTDWELECLRRASLRAVAGHEVARQQFAAGASEYEIHQAYLAATSHNEPELPYDNIVALNEHAAVLHYQLQQRDRPARHHSLLLDAGATHLGYGADISRTHAADPAGGFGQLIQALDIAQQALLQQVRPGASFVDLHLRMHELLAGVLQGAGLVNASVEAQIEQGITRAFFPHGLGHLLGLQVHDVGGWQQGAAGMLQEPPPEHPFLRLTRTLQPGFVITIEPGLYFIPSLLDKLRQGRAADAVNWQQVETLMPCGGIRIEDNVAITAQGHENMTRDAFAAAGREGF
ncbi:Xaa-Pro dipeptidase [Marinobacterium rhizophilum]|uniref:Xaa-Pro dipeptidase n=2 Tax=Marinobacterium rhizophilum TaxID=420402 RepID=A0ABY5HPY3_9GAMM|nr:Xaa-Pro dipeptidase [Marinobacterium rhizophilum]